MATPSPSGECERDTTPSPIGECESVSEATHSPSSHHTPIPSSTLWLEKVPPFTANKSKLKKRWARKAGREGSKTRSRRMKSG